MARAAFQLTSTCSHACKDTARYFMDEEVERRLFSLDSQTTRTAQNQLHILVEQLASPARELWEASMILWDYADITSQIPLPLFTAKKLTSQLDDLIIENERLIQRYEYRPDYEKLRSPKDLLDNCLHLCECGTEVFSGLITGDRLQRLTDMICKLRSVAGLEAYDQVQSYNRITRFPAFFQRAKRLRAIRSNLQLTPAQFDYIRVWLDSTTGMIWQEHEARRDHDLPDIRDIMIRKDEVYLQTAIAFGEKVSMTTSTQFWSEISMDPDFEDDLRRRFGSARLDNKHFPESLEMNLAELIFTPPEKWNWSKF